MLAVVNPAYAQHHHGQSGGSLKPPKVYLDKSPRVVAYQLQRLDNQRLLLVERSNSDPKYAAVYDAILTRPGVSSEHRFESLAALAKLRDKTRVAVLVDAISDLDSDDLDQRLTAEQLAKMLLDQPAAALRDQRTVLRTAIDGDHKFLRTIAAAGLIVSGHVASVVGNPASTLSWLRAIPWIPNPSDRSALRDRVVSQVRAGVSDEVKSAAIRALGFIDSNSDDSFVLIAPLIADPNLRDAVIASSLRIPNDQRSPKVANEMLQNIIKIAEQTLAADRTSDSFVDAMQLADQLMARVDPETSREARQRLDEFSVRVVRIKTVPEEMRYDKPYFVVAAGKPVQLVLDNEDMMPHNLVITTPGALKEVAQLGLEAGPRGIHGGLPYVPRSDQVLQATDLVPAHQQARLTFDAPNEPGEYPFVCTFPQHWYRMYGVMVVTEDLDQWQQNPVEPANPIGSNRSFVKAWMVDDLKHELDDGLRGRSPKIGQQIFVEASCAGCHKVRGEGGVIGPDLTNVMQRWKGDRLAVLREILDPSHRIEPKYAMQKVLTVDGQVISGVLAAEDDDTVTLLISPDAKEPTVIARDDIEQMTPSATSIMPKALLDQYTKDEIFELIAYLNQ